MAETVIEIKNLSKVFKRRAGRDRIAAIDNIDITVKRGEVFSILGPNGSGKTTLIKLILGLIFPTSGSIRILGKAPTDVPMKNRIGFVSELPYFYEFLTPIELIRFYGRLFELDKAFIESRATMLLDTVGLTEYRDQRIRTFSKGMLQRLGIAIGLVNDPELLFFDEPVLGLDPIGIRRINELIKDLKRKGKTIVLTSHVLQDATDISDTLVVLDKGKLIASGTPEELLSLKDNIEVVVKGIDDGTISRVRSAIEKEGLEILSVGYKKAALADFFIGLIEKGRKR